MSLSRFARHLSRVFPATQPPQRLVGDQPLDEHARLLQSEHGLGDEGARNRMPVRRRTPLQARPHVDKGLDARHIEHDNDLFLLVGEWPDLVPQHRKKKALNVAPGI
jgi:hypothetical protein